MMVIDIAQHRFKPLLAETEPSWLSWLLYEDPLTERLQQNVKEARVQLIHQRWQAPDWWDTHVLQLNDDIVFHREILMCSGQEAYWYARTIIPKNTFLSDVCFFNRLQNESLSKLIFNEPKVQRIHLFHYPIDRQCIEYYWPEESLLENIDLLWARMSLLMFQETYPFFLVEMLFPTLMRFSL